VREFVNADGIAAGISPFNPESVAFEAGRIMLHRIQGLMAEGVDFAFETTLSAKSYLPLINSARGRGYNINLLFFWLTSPEFAKQRVARRVRKGGHNIPPTIIERRYCRGIYNLLNLYIPVADNWMVYDNMDAGPVLIAKGTENFEQIIVNPQLWGIIQQQSKHDSR
jgi:predicted ABC-type ATPase